MLEPDGAMHMKQTDRHRSSDWRYEIDGNWALASMNPIDRVDSVTCRTRAATRIFPAALLR